MGSRPGCRDVGIGPTHAARVGYDRLGWLAACSHARQTPEHEAPISAHNVCETLRDKSSCRARFRGHFQRLDVLRFFAAQRKRPIHFRKFPVSTALPRQFGKNGQTSVLFRLAPINFHLRLHGSAPRTEVNVPAHPLFRSSRAYFKKQHAPGVRRIIRLQGATELVRRGRLRPAPNALKATTSGSCAASATRPAGQGVAQNTVEVIDLVSAIRARPHHRAAGREGIRAGK
jgi:hypothetical protein